MQTFHSYTDEQLISMMRDGEPGVMEFLMDKYKNLVRKRANALYLLGGETEDLIQEGMIGLFKAIRDFTEGQSSFFSFADLCINRQLYHAIESANRKKHGPLNSYISLSGAHEPEQEGIMEEYAGTVVQDPESIIIEKENVELILADINSRLSSMEQQVLEHYLDGMNYHQIAVALGKTDKAVDNALHRIRSKISTKNYTI